MEKKILVAVDGSYCSLNEINYLGAIFGGHEDLKVHLVCIVPSGSMPIGSDWVDDADKMNMLSPIAQKKLLLAKKYVKDETALLVRHGFQEDQITGAVQVSRSSVAADLVAEAQSGTYDALLIGRRGIGKLHALVMGSVTTTVLEKCHSVPRWIVDGKVESRKFLVPVDRSIHTLRAVDHLSFILAGVNDIEIILFHSAAWLGAQDKSKEVEKAIRMFGKEWCDKHLYHPEGYFYASEQILRDNGFDMNCVTRAEESRGLEPARDIVLQIRKKNIGTIVMGRRGPDEAKSMLGGVSDRVLSTINDVMLWLVN